MVDLKHGYDTASNRLYRRNEMSSGSTHSQLYTYDNLQRLATFAQGALNSTNDNIATATQSQDWALDATGNWKNFTQQTPGLNQQRAHNTANEITPKCDSDTTICATTGVRWFGPQHDATAT